MTNNPTSEAHDLAVRQIAANRFPFPGQADWPSDYVTLTNQSTHRRGVPAPLGTEYPDIVIIDGTGEIREIGEIETSVDPLIVERWARASAACDHKTTSGVQHFFVYVPPGNEQEAIRLLDAHGVSYAGVRTWSRADDGSIEINPIVTPGDPKDHRAR
ncbi:MAG: hypothetical protein WBW04_10465 [Nitrolancea sp.]